MQIKKSNIQAYNERYLSDHQEQFSHLNAQLDKSEINADDIVERLQKFQVAIPSWALGAGGTRSKNR